MKNAENPNPILRKMLQKCKDVMKTLQKLYKKCYKIINRNVYNTGEKKY